MLCFIKSFAYVFLLSNLHITSWELGSELKMLSLYLMGEWQAWDPDLVILFSFPSVALWYLQVVPFFPYFFVSFVPWFRELCSIIFKLFCFCHQAFPQFLQITGLL